MLTRFLPDAPAAESFDGVDIRRCIRTWNLGPLFGLSFVGSLAWGLWRRRRDFDLVLAGQAPWEAVATGLIGPRLGKPSLVRIANTGPFGDLAKLERTKGASLLRNCVLRNTGFVTLCNAGELELKQIGCTDAVIHRCTNGVDTKLFHPSLASEPERDRTVLFVGRLAPQKDPETLLSAWRLVNPSGERRLLIAGSGPMAATLQAECERQRLQGVEFLGSQADMPSLYRRASVFVLPSLSEGCSNALLEAMASGLCPVATEIPGNVDVVANDQNGLLFAPGDVAQLAAALQSVLEDPERRRRLGDEARRHVLANHDLDVVAAKYLDVFKQALNRTG